jgi:hypothetical protein
MGNNYYHEITSALQGQIPGLEGIPSARIDWYGSSAVLELYDSTSGSDREEIIRAMGQIVEAGKEPPIVVAQVLHIAASLDLAQIEPNVARLQHTSLASMEPVKSALRTYTAYRQASSLSRR